MTIENTNIKNDEIEVIVKPDDVNSYEADYDTIEEAIETGVMETSTSNHQSPTVKDSYVTTKAEPLLIHASSKKMSGRSRVQAELDMLRNKNLAQTHKGKYKGSSVALSAEETLAFLTAQKSKKGNSFQPNEITSSNSGDAILGSWYLQQRAMTASDKQKKSEAEALLRGYRASHHQKEEAAPTEREWRKSKYLGLGVGAVTANGVVADAKSTTYSYDVERRLISNTTKEQNVNELQPKEKETNETNITHCMNEAQETEKNHPPVDFEKTENDQDVENEHERVELDSNNEDEIFEEPKEDTELELDMFESSRMVINQDDDEIELDSNVANQLLAQASSATVKENITMEEIEALILNNSEIELNENLKEKELAAEEKKTENEESTEVKQKQDAENVAKETTEMQSEEESLQEDYTSSDESTGGIFEMSVPAWRNYISREKNALFPPEPNRYHLYVAHACPWAHRTMIARALKGLEHVISYTSVHPIWRQTRPENENDEHRGWVFANPDNDPFTNAAGFGGPFPAIFDGNEPDFINQCTSIREVYEKANDTLAKYTVPVLWDKKRQTIVSNESSDIIRMLNTEFNLFAKYPEVDLYPESKRVPVDALNAWIYPTFNNGVYRCGLATTQEDYLTCVKQTVTAFDRIENILRNQRFLAGDYVTEADVRLFPTLLRFDEVYNVYFKVNSRMVEKSEVLLNYCREMYQMPGVAGTCNMEQIKYHYYCSHTELNRFSIVPIGTGFMKLLDQPHNRGLIACVDLKDTPEENNSTDYFNSVLQSHPQISLGADFLIC